MWNMLCCFTAYVYSRDIELVDEQMMQQGSYCHTPAAEYVFTECFGPSA